MEAHTKIIVISSDGRSKIYPRGTVDLDSMAGTVVQDIKELLSLNGDYELYVKIPSATRLGSIPFDSIEGVVILPADVKPSRSVDLGTNYS